MYPDDVLYDLLWLVSTETHDSDSELSPKPFIAGIIGVSLLHSTAALPSVHWERRGPLVSTGGHGAW